MAIDLTRFNATFLTESLTGLDAMENDLLELERGNKDPELWQAIFRVVHSIKGGSGSLGFEQIAEFSHHLESLLDNLRMGGIDIRNLPPWRSSFRPRKSWNELSQMLRVGKF